MGAHMSIDKESWAQLSSQVEAALRDGSIKLSRRCGKRLAQKGLVVCSGCGGDGIWRGLGRLILCDDCDDVWASAEGDA